MTSLKCVQAQTASTITILRDINGNATEEATVAVSRRSFISKVKMHRYSKLEIFLALVSLVLLVALVVVVVVVGGQKSEDTTNTDKRIKTSEGAIKNLARILSNMDRTVNPCTDFYQYACGGWERRSFIDDSEDSVFPFLEIYHENKQQLKKILENIDIKLNYSSNAAMLKAFEMYSSCINTTVVEQFGDLELRTLLVELADFNMTKNRSNSSYDWQTFVVKIKRRLNMDAFFKLQVLDDLRNSSLKRIAMRAVQLPLNYYYYTALEAQHNRERYLQFMIDVMTLVTSKEREFVQREMKKVLELETNITKTQIAPNQRLNFSLVYNLVTIEKLANMTDQFNWLSFFRNLTSGVGYKLSPQETLLISSPKMVQKILILLQSTEASIVSNYLAWKIVYGLIEVLPSKYGTLFRRYRGGQIKSKWDTCVEETAQALPLETTLIFAHHALQKGTVEKARSIVRDVKDIFLKVISKQSWISRNSQKGAKKKAKAMIFHLGYPENVTSKLLKDTSSKFTVDVSYFTTYQNIKSYTFMKHFKSLKTNKNRDEYLEKDPMKPTAFYYHTRNVVGVAVGFLQTKLFSLENYQSANFGSLGMVIGHEMTHGYDGVGHTYNSDGNQLPRWVSLNSSKEIIEKTKCLRKSYSNLTYNDRKLGSFGNYREQYCDTGGLTLALEAYKEWKNRPNEEEILPAHNITHNQLFFLSYAQMWCAKYKSSEESRLLKGGAYPFPLRMQGTVMNSHEFADAFSCARGTAMNPPKKCKVWET